MLHRALSSCRRKCNPLERHPEELQGLRAAVLGVKALDVDCLGIVIGRSLWNLFANSIHAVPRVTVPTVTVLVIAALALVLANVIAALPARIAARTSPAILLRAE